MGLWSLESWFESKPASHTERCPSGLRSTLGKRVLGKLNRGFESHPLRHFAGALRMQQCARVGDIRFGGRPARGGNRSNPPLSAPLSAPEGNSGHSARPLLEEDKVKST